MPTQIKSAPLLKAHLNPSWGSMAPAARILNPITGTVDWVKCELVLEVPLAAINVTIGCLLRGPGQLWCDDVKFEIVGKGVPVTDPSGEPAKPAKPDDPDASVKRAPRFSPSKSQQPRNLSFEEGG